LTSIFCIATQPVHPRTTQVVYTMLNGAARVGASSLGWAVPMATDIAFAMGVFGFFRSRMPPGAEAFLLTLATVDDLGAIAVIAVL
jgi:Na+:H+ antiporter, NhaA family